MSGETRFPAKVGFDMALMVMGWLADVTERIEIAGSLRRDKQDLGDVELVMMPKFEATRNLFGEPTGKINLLDARCDEMLTMGLVQKRLNKNGHAIAWGERYKALVVNGIPLDLFIVMPDRQWGPTMLIRTGPGSANQVLITAEGVKNSDGNRGILPKGMVWDDGALWKGGRRVDTPEERDVFAALDMPYIPPYARTVEDYQLWASRRVFRYDWMKGLRSQAYGYVERKWKAAPTWVDVGLEFSGAIHEWPYNVLDIAPGLHIRVEDFVGQRIAVLGSSGMGKSNTVSVLAEELAGKLPLTIVDLESEYHSLRDEYEFIVAGRGAHVDRVIGIDDAKALAKEVIDGDKSVILDLLEFSKGERDELLRVYLETMWDIELKARKPHTIILEEAHEFIPQRKTNEALEIFKTVALRGRKRGLGMILASQRAAMVDKDVLTQANMLILHLVQYPNDIRTYQGILPMNPAESEALIKSLKVGQAIVRRPGMDGKQRADVFSIRKRHSVDLGATPELGQLSLETA